MMHCFITLLSGSIWICCAYLIHAMYPGSPGRAVFWSVGICLMAMVQSQCLSVWYPVQQCVIAMVLLWCVRIVFFSLLPRAKGRVTQAITPQRFVQNGIYMACTALPILDILSQYISMPTVMPLGVWVGMSLWMLGFTIQCIAGYAIYRYTIHHPLGILRWGLFSVCRYPQYLGEITMCLGLWVMSVWYVEISHAWVTFVLSPLLLMVCVIRPILDRRDLYMSQRFGYTEYAAHVPCIIPSMKMFQKNKL